MFIVHRRHQRGGRRQCLVDEDEDGLVGRQLDSLADDVDELAYGQIRWDEIFLLVNSSDITLFDFLADNLKSKQVQYVSTMSWSPEYRLDERTTERVS